MPTKLIERLGCLKEAGEVELLPIGEAVRGERFGDPEEAVEEDEADELF